MIVFTEFVGKYCWF